VDDEGPALGTDSLRVKFGGAGPEEDPIFFARALHQPREREDTP